MVVILLSGFATTAMIEAAVFSTSEVYSKKLRIIFQSIYSYSQVQCTALERNELNYIVLIELQCVSIQNVSCVHNSQFIF